MACHAHARCTREPPRQHSIHRRIQLGHIKRCQETEGAHVERQDGWCGALEQTGCMQHCPVAAACGVGWGCQTSRQAMARAPTHPATTTRSTGVSPRWGGRCGWCMRAACSTMTCTRLPPTAAMRAATRSRNAVAAGRPAFCTSNTDSGGDFHSSTATEASRAGVAATTAEREARASPSVRHRLGALNQLRSDRVHTRIERGRPLDKT